MKKLILLFLISMFFTGCEKKVSPEEKEWKEKVKMGDFYFANKNIDMALKFWTESLEFKKEPLTYEKIVTSYIIKNEFNEAKKYALSGLTYFQNNDNLLFNLGLTHFYLGEYESALRVLNGLMERNEYYPDAHYLKGLVYEKKGDYLKAKEEFIKEININPGSKRAWKKIKEMKNEK